MAPTVSVIVPTIGGLATLGRALDSVAAQTRAPLETLLVDDGSPPAQAAALQTLPPRYRKIGLRLIRLQENRGPASARNAGWAESRGELLALLDDDDAWHPRKLELQAALMEEHPELVLTAHDVPCRGASAPGWAELRPPLPLHRYRRWPALAVNPAGTCSSWMLRRSCPQRFLEGRRHAEDWLLLLQLLLSGAGAGHLGVPLAAMFKPGFGASGLSGELGAMLRGELDTYARLRAEGLLGGAAVRGLQTLALVKAARRALVVRVLRPLGSWAAPAPPTR